MAPIILLFSGASNVHMSGETHAVEIASADPNKNMMDYTFMLQIWQF